MTFSLDSKVDFKFNNLLFLYMIKLCKCSEDIYYIKFESLLYMHKSIF